MAIIEGIHIQNYRAVRDLTMDHIWNRAAAGMPGYPGITQPEPESQC